MRLKSTMFVLILLSGCKAEISTSNRSAAPLETVRTEEVNVPIEEEVISEEKEETPEPVAVPNIADEQVSFVIVDENEAQNKLDATVSIVSAAPIERIAKFNIYWGSSASQKKIELPLLLSLPAEKSLSQEFSIKDADIPTGATHILIFAANETGESSGSASAKLVDRIVVSDDLSSLTKMFNTAVVSLRGALDQVVLEFAPNVVVDIGTLEGTAVAIHSSKILVDGASDETFKISINGGNGTWNGSGSDTPSLISSTAMRSFLDDSSMTYYFATPGVVGMEAVLNNKTSFDLTLDGVYFNSQYVFASSKADRIEVLGSSSGIGNSAFFCLGGDDDVKLKVIYKSFVHGGAGDDRIEFPGVWELRVLGEADNDILVANQMLFADSDTAPMLPNNMDVRGGDGSDQIIFALVDGDSSGAVANFSNTNTFSGDDGDDTLLIGDASFNNGSIINIEGGSGSDKVWFKPRSMVMPTTFNLTGGAGVDRLYFHGDIPTASTTFLADLATSVVASGWEIIDMGAVSARHGRAPNDVISRNNSTPIVLKLAAAAAQELASANEHAGLILYIEGDTDGNDRVDLTGYTRDDPSNQVGFVAFQDAGITLMVEIGLHISTDNGVSFGALN